jgi:3-dehydroquinate synthase
MDSVRVNLGPRSYDIAFRPADGPADVGALVLSALPNTSTALVVSDANTRPHTRAIEAALAARGLRTGSATVPAGEASKSPDQLAKLYDALYDLAADRKTVVVAVGGGVIGDLAGFAAATYNRGLPLVMVPTSLLAMVDSSVGGKTGINHPKGKNLIGAFHQPSGVWIDLAVLDTLPDREYASGLAEVVKYGVILDAAFFDYLEANAHALRERRRDVVHRTVVRCCQLKAQVVERDEYETTGLRAVLNYGHTFAHGFETVAGYGTLLHGEAVAIGMMCAARLADRLERIGPDVAHRQEAVLKSLNLPVTPGRPYPTDELLAVMRRDKKAVGGNMRFILPTKIGAVTLVDDVPEVLVRAVLEGR